jgi:inactive dipeptidyl peptidase 10
LTPPDEGPRVKGQRIKLQDIIDGEYLPSKINGTWIGGKNDRILNRHSLNFWLDKFMEKLLLKLFFVFFLSFIAEEFLYRNQWGEISLLNIKNLSERILMSNTTYVSIL